MVKARDFDSRIVGSSPTTPAIYMLPSSNRYRKPASQVGNTSSSLVGSTIRNTMLLYGALDELVESPPFHGGI